MVVLDDHRLFAHILGDQSHEPREPVATTTMWWWRLLSALDDTRGGVFSRRATTLGRRDQKRVLRAVAALPNQVKILDLRALLPAMAVAARDHRLDLLAAEAFVVASVLRAPIRLGVATPLLDRAAAAAGIDCRVVVGW